MYKVYSTENTSFEDQYFCHHCKHCEDAFDAPMCRKAADPVTSDYALCECVRADPDACGFEAKWYEDEK